MKTKEQIKSEIEAVEVELQKAQIRFNKAMDNIGVYKKGSRANEKAWLEYAVSDSWVSFYNIKLGTLKWVLDEVKK